MKVIIYTAIFGDFDKLKEDQYPQDDNVEFVCFTDNPNLKSNTWRVEHREPVFKHPRMDAKMYKILCHQFLDCDISLWIDGTHRIVNNINNLINNYLNECDIVFHKHDRRTCIFDEADYIISRKKENPEKIQLQIDKYRKNGMPENTGLVLGGTILRKHTSDIINLNNYWWSEICSNSNRDQISFHYIAYKYKFKYACFDFNHPELFQKNEFIEYLPHYENYKKIVDEKILSSPCILYCYSKLTQKVIEYLKNHEIKLLGIYDKDRQKVPENIYVDIFNSKIDKNTPVIICSYTYFFDIEKNLQKIGFKNIYKSI